MQMDLLALLDRPWLFLLGLIWIAVHIVLLWCPGKLLKVPFFYFAIGSQSNIGGPASAPVVAAAFHPALAPVGVLLGTAPPSTPLRRQHDQVAGFVQHRMHGRVVAHVHVAGDDAGLGSPQ